MTKYLVIVWVLIHANIVEGQETFHNIYFLDDSVVSIRNIFPTDSCYYFCGRELSSTSSLVESVFGKIGLTGQMDFYQHNVDLSSNQFVARADLQLDSDENFTFVARNGGGYSVPRLIKYDPAGSEILDTVYTDLWSVDSMKFYDFGRILTDNVDSSHYLFFTYYDELNDDNSATGNPGETGSMLAKLDEGGNFIWRKRFADLGSQNFKPNYIVLNMQKISDTTLLLTIQERKQQLPSPDQYWSKIHFYVVDSSGNDLDHKILQDSQLNYGRYGLLKTETSVIYPNIVSEYSPIPPNTQPSWRFRSVITCLDQNYQIKWKDTLIEKFVTASWYHSPQKLISTSDTTFAGAFTHEYFYVNEDSSFFYLLFPVKLFNKDLETGEDVWTRNYRYFPEDSARRYTHEIIDLERTYDHGYIMCGSVISADSLQAGSPAQYGYVIKTNCLGFLGNPEAAASYTFGEENTVLFHNESIQAGSFLWDFGDGTTLTTGEDTNAISHEYFATGIYTIQLIGYGCAGQNDTISFTIDFEYTEPGYAGDGTLLTLYPNPISAGNSLAFFIGNIPEGTHYVNVSNSLGQRVDRFRIEAGNTNYLFPLDYAAGMYHFTLQKNNEILEFEKLIVE